MPVTILGPHRSGTSMITRLLNLCGLFLGTGAELGMTGEQNPKGYWEHIAFVDINQRLLAQFGGTLYDPPVLPPQWWEMAEVQPLVEEARTLTSQSFAGQAQWGWKDPRTTLTVPFWRQVLPDLCFVVTLRNPLDTAASIIDHSQERLSRRKAVALWQHYTELALWNTQPQERILVCYEDFLPDPRPALAPVLQFLGLPAIVPGSARDLALQGFVDAALKHHQHTDAEVLASPDVFLGTRLLYAGLRQQPEATAALFARPALEEGTARAWGPDEPAVIQAQQAQIGALSVDVEWQSLHIAELDDWVRRQGEGLDWLTQQLEEQRQGLEWHEAHCLELERELARLDVINGYITLPKKALSWLWRHRKVVFRGAG
jgi:hypothetical protein